MNVGEHAPRNVTNDMCDSILNPSKHCVLKMKITRPVNHIEIDSSQQARNHIAWHKVSDEHIKQYRSELSMYLLVIELPDAVVNCNDILCTNDEHKEQIEVHCVQLIDMCLKAGSKCSPHIQTKQH